MNVPTILRTKDFGDFVLRLQYVNPAPNDPQSGYEPAIVISRGRRAASGSRSAWIIMLSSAWKYVDEDDAHTGGHSKYMVMATEKIARMLHLSTSVDSRFKIAEAILGTLEELINMPPYEPPREPQGSIVGRIGQQKIDVEVL